MHSPSHELFSAAKSSLSSLDSLSSYNPNAILPFSPLLIQFVVFSSNGEFSLVFKTYFLIYGCIAEDLRAVAATVLHRFCQSQPSSIPEVITPILNHLCTQSPRFIRYFVFSLFVWNFFLEIFSCTFVRSSVIVLKLVADLSLSSPPNISHRILSQLFSCLPFLDHRDIAYGVFFLWSLFQFLFDHCLRNESTYLPYFGNSFITLPLSVSTSICWINKTNHSGS